jgi:hypothetical protein
MTDTTTVRDTLVVDRGPVRNAALILARRSTLAEHVVILDGPHVTTIEVSEDSVPFSYWGSGTQALWRLLSAIAYTSEAVSLYEVAAACDTRNRAAVAAAVAALMEAS